MDKSFEELLDSEKPLLVDFYATWCGPCQILAPILKEVKDTFKERIAIIKIDVDKNQEIASHYRIKGVPTMMLFQNGKQLWRQSGVLSKIEIANTIMEHCIWPELPGQQKTT
ncbi:thioredoxin [Flavobacterium caeni]|uniref:Thioredoxin n=1 Tax=Flavobacterium caeni TaxID=490189 RepID=A0A1G5K932_9FLAO|nr:thioredoxin [Flavobacterium caeni]SCY96449.1 thioredoxin [Flavobacterium caeni]